MSTKGVFIVLTWTGESVLSYAPEPDDVVYTMSGDLLDVDENGEHLAGKFTAHYVDVERALNERVSVFEAMDAHSATTWDYYEALFSEREEFSEKLLDVLDHEVIGLNLLILDRLELLPSYRGKRLGLRAVRHMMERFSAGAAVVAIKPFPLQYEDEPIEEDKKAWRRELGLVEFPGSEQAATEKLRAYYRNLGFFPLDESPFMVRSTAWQLPSLEEE